MVHTMDLSSSISRFACRNSSTKSLFPVAFEANGLNESIEEPIVGGICESAVLDDMVMSVTCCDAVS